ncbi:MAG: hypothetical protein SOR88_09565 [Roseburia inulinivorans]|jgi:hypothetical protein|nr:hypothetical protein [Roseburia inulinivorans]DAV94628.1 MAG TPA: GAG POLYprotein, RNA-BINDING, CAPSID PROTEIN.25A [Caudoviricetes sp.]
MFNRDSVVVKIWVKLVQEEKYSVDQIPNLSNLREEVKAALL